MGMVSVTLDVITVEYRALSDAAGRVLFVVNVRLVVRIPLALSVEYWKIAAAVI